MNCEYLCTRLLLPYRRYQVLWGVKLYYQQDGSVDMRISDREYSLSTSVRENLEGDLLDYLTRLIHLKPDTRTLGFDFGALTRDPHRIRTVADDLVTLHALKERHEIPATRESVQALHNVLDYVNALSDDGCEVDSDKAIRATGQLANMAMILQMNDRRLRVVEDYMKYISLGGR